MVTFSALTYIKTGAIAADVYKKFIKKLPCKNLHRCNVISGMGRPECVHQIWCFKPELLACRFAHCLASVPPGRPGQSIRKIFFVHNDISDVGYNT
ncbi:uncharacterized protein TNCT_468101 [Trichonephila clavata]|uniref:Uncharacterized protein n=1 Tax=Trichonephila clavata TaxID=2740835 RepID=A0A8X6L4A2_TRICU|nr:uncharacterized protein TNCT_468101 [Trichonephila clavata]